MDNEFTVNSCLITFVFESLESLQALKPLDFLSPNVNSNVLIPLAIKTPLSKSNKNTLLKSWETINQLLKKFWSKWSLEYLLSLRKRHDKLVKNNNNCVVKNGSVVLVFEDNIPRNL